MRSEPTITKIEVHQFEYEINGVAAGPSGANYLPGAKSKRMAYAVKIMTDIGVTGEFVGGSAIDFAGLPSFQHQQMNLNTTTNQ